MRAYREMKIHGALMRLARCAGVALAALSVSCAVSCAKKPAPPAASPGLSSSCTAMFANGTDRCTLSVTGAKQPAVWSVAVYDKKGKKLDAAVTTADEADGSITIMPSFTPCHVEVSAKVADKTFTREFNVEPDYSDSDKDGFPDVAELNSQNDRLAFRAWFVNIAASQFDAPSDGWDEDARDCAGLVRFAYRESLRAHDTAALAKFRSLARTDIPDVRKYNYPDVPVIGTLLFRGHAGGFSKGDLTDGSMTPFATARFLQEANTHFVSKNIAEALPGDLLFYLHFDDPQMPYHTMIFLGAAGRGGGDPYLIYHTGPVGGGKGKIKKVPVEALMGFPDARWHPAPGNEYFLGVYRFNILG